MSPSNTIIILSIVLFIGLVAVFWCLFTRLESPAKVYFTILFAMLYICVIGECVLNSNKILKYNLDYWRNNRDSYLEQAEKAETEDDKKFLIEIKAKHAQEEYEKYYDRLFNKE